MRVYALIFSGYIPQLHHTHTVTPTFLLLDREGLLREVHLHSDVQGASLVVVVVVGHAFPRLLDDGTVPGHFLPRDCHLHRKRDNQCGGS